MEVMSVKPMIWFFWGWIFDIFWIFFGTNYLVAYSLFFETNSIFLKRNHHKYLQHEGVFEGFSTFIFWTKFG
jgi:hypothetical protein